MEWSVFGFIIIHVVFPSVFAVLGKDKGKLSFYNKHCPRTAVTVAENTDIFLKTLRNECIPLGIMKQNHLKSTKIGTYL